MKVLLEKNGRYWYLYNEGGQSLVDDGFVTKTDAVSYATYMKYHVVDRIIFNQ